MKKYYRIQKIKMVKLNGEELSCKEDEPPIIDLIKMGHLVKKNGEYFQTIKSMIDLNKAMTRLRRSINNPLWKFYYSFFKW